MVLQRELEIRYESHMTGTPVATIVEQQSAESGMYAGGEGMEVLYLVPLIYLVWPVLFNLAGHLCSRRSRVALGDRGRRGGALGAGTLPKEAQDGEGKA